MALFFFPLQKTAYKPLQMDKNKDYYIMQYSEVVLTSDIITVVRFFLISAFDICVPYLLKLFSPICSTLNRSSFQVLHFTKFTSLKIQFLNFNSIFPFDTLFKYNNINKIQILKIIVNKRIIY